jgi:hypothetical protein
MALIQRVWCRVAMGPGHHRTADVVPVAEDLRLLVLHPRLEQDGDLVQSQVRVVGQRDELAQVVGLEVRLGVMAGQGVDSLQPAPDVHGACLGGGTRAGLTAVGPQPTTGAGPQVALPGRPHARLYVGKSDPRWRPG